MTKKKAEVKTEEVVEVDPVRVIEPPTNDAWRVVEPGTGDPDTTTIPLPLVGEPTVSTPEKKGKVTVKNTTRRSNKK